MPQLWRGRVLFMLTPELGCGFGVVLFLFCFLKGQKRLKMVGK